MSNSTSPTKERGGKAPDPPQLLQSCYRAVLYEVRRSVAKPGLPLVIGGKSMGGRMASHLAADGAEIDGLLLLGYPLHPAGHPEKLRAEHLEKIDVPMLFVAGTRDALCRLDLLQPTLTAIDTRRPGLAELHIIAGGNHSFDLLKSIRRSREDVLDEISGVTARWLSRLHSH